MAFPAGWQYRVAITIDKDDIDADLTDWTLVFDEGFDSVLTQVNGPLDADGTRASINGGGDVRFSSDSAGNTQLACDIRKWITDNTPANGEIELAVKIGTVSSSTDTTIYMWWGKSGESQPGAATTYGQYNAYDSDYEAVYSFNDATSGNVSDRTGNGHDATPNTGGTGSITKVAGELGDAWDFDGNPNEDTVGRYAENVFTQTTYAQATWEAYLQQTETEDAINAAGYVATTDGLEYPSWQFDHNSTNPNGAYDLSIRGNDLTNPVFYDTSWNDTDWHVYAIAQLANNTLVLWRDGTDTATGIDLEDDCVWECFAINVNRGHNRTANARYSEVRFSIGTVRSDAWLRADDHNFRNTPGFLTWGAIQDLNQGISVAGVLSGDIDAVGGVSAGSIAAVGSVAWQ